MDEDDDEDEDEGSSVEEGSKLGDSEDEDEDDNDDDDNDDDRSASSSEVDSVFGSDLDAGDEDLGALRKSAGLRGSGSRCSASMQRYTITEVQRYLDAKKKNLSHDERSGRRRVDKFFPT